MKSFNKGTLFGIMIKYIILAHIYICGICHMRTLQGSVTRNIRSDKISYASQTPWIVNSTVQENITFGQPLDEKRYKEVIAATCLDMDLKTLPAGDQTEIGERGINLSGGQRQRVSVARALYAPSDLVILDDPLSALDAHVGATLFEKGIQKFLAESNRTVVLITHHLQYLQDADLVSVFLYLAASESLIYQRSCG